MNEIIYNGKHSRDFGIYISGSGTFNSPERDAETISIPGKNGDLEVSHNRFKNIAVEYPAFIVNNFKDNAAAARAWLLAASGYHRLEDTYHSEYFRLGRFTGPLDFDMKFLNRAGECKMQFDCKPQRFLKSGEEITEIPRREKKSGNPVSVNVGSNCITSLILQGKTSPTGVGAGQFDKNGEFPTTGWVKSGSVFYKESAILDKGISSPLLSHSLPYVGTFDSAAAFSAAAASYTFAIGSGTSYNIRGRIYIKAPCATVEELSNWLRTINRAVYYQSTAYATATQVYVGLSVTDANGYHGYAAGPMARLMDGDTVDFITGEANRPLSTPTTETVPISEPITYAPGTLTIAAENTVDVTYKIDEDVVVYNPTEFTALPLIRVYGTAPGTLTVGNTIVQINAISEYVDLDCELQDAFKGSTNCNGNVYAPNFPALSPGGTGISFSGGITKIEIKPRWWTV